MFHDIDVSHAVSNLGNLYYKTNTKEKVLQVRFVHA